jgi:ribonuclease HI
MDIKIYTDGACSDNGKNGIGGWAAIILMEKKCVRVSGNKENTTNNIMELEAIKNAIKYIRQIKVITKSYPQKVTIFSDSAYCLNGLNSWCSGWVKNGWKTAKGDDVKNKELWKETYNLLCKARKYTTIEFVKVKAHTGNTFNEEADTLAVEEVKNLKEIIKNRKM